MDTVEMNAVESGRMLLRHAINAGTLFGISRGACSVGMASLVLRFAVSLLDINHDLANAPSSALPLTTGQRLYVDYSEPSSVLIRGASQVRSLSANRRPYG